MLNESTRVRINVDKDNRKALWMFKQGDDGLLKLSLFKASAPLDVTGQTIKLAIKRPDKTLVEHIGGVTVSGGNELDIVMKNSIFKVAGVLECELEISDEKGKMTTTSFCLIVKEKILNGESIASTNELEELDRIKKEYQDMKTEFSADEEIRSGSEVARVNSENSRNSSETNRTECETLRNKSELLRESKELSRISSEDDRVKKETLRVEHEAGRDTQEKNRVKSEDKRMANFEKIRGEFEDLKKVSIEENAAIGLQNQINISNDKIVQLEEDVVSVVSVVTGQAKIYGVEVDFANLTFTRLLDSVGLNGGVGFNNIAPFGGMKRVVINTDGRKIYFGEANYIEDGSIGNIFVEIPKFYYKVIPLLLEPISDGIGSHIAKAQWLVSATDIPGFKTHPAFVRNGIEKDFIYVGAYEGSIYDVSAGVFLLADEQVADFNSDKLCSITGAKPCSGKTQNLHIDNARLLCKNNGNKYSQFDFTSTSALQLLHLIEYASFDAQTTIGRGAVDIADNPNTENNSIITGGTSNLGSNSGTAEGANGKVSVSYRGVENFWGNIWKFVDGLSIEAKSIHNAYWANDNIKTNTANGYNKINFTLAKTNGYADRIGYDKENDFVFLTTRTNGASNKPCNDYFYQNNTYNGWLIAPLGGAWDGGSRSGAYCWALGSGSGIRDRNVGARLLYIE